MTLCANKLNAPCMRRWLLLVAGVLIILGMRFALTERFTSTVPLADDWLMMDKLEAWSQGGRDWGWLLERHNGTHLTLFSRLLAAVSVELNCLWEPRVDNLLHALVYAACAVVLARYFSKIVPERATLMTALVLLFFAIPFAGVRSTWAFLSAFDFCTIFAFLAFTAMAWRSEKLWALPVALVLAVAASFSLGSGCMAGLAMALVAGAEMVLARRVPKSGLLWSGCGLAVFLGFYLTMGKPTVTNEIKTFVLTESIGAAFKALAWPIFLTPLAVSALAPFSLLAWRYLRGGEDFRSDSRVRALMLAWTWLLLQAFAIGFMRGDNGNRGIPSMRYNDLLMPFVFVEAATLLSLLAREPSRKLLLVRNAWTLLLVAGMTLQLLWRTWPFMARENGEFSEWVRQRNVRDFFRGNPESLRTAQREVKDSSAIYMIGDRIEPMLNEIASGKWDIKTAGSMAGIQLKFPEASGVIAGGVPPEYFTNPALEYYGTFSPQRLESATGMAVSEPFGVKGNSLTFDLIVDKKARFDGYGLDGLGLKLITADGAEIDVLRSLRAKAPSLLRDRENVCVPVTPGSYTLSLADTSSDLSLAFSAPMEGGRVSMAVHQSLASAKLLIATGVGFLGLLACTRSAAA